MQELMSHISEQYCSYASDDPLEDKILECLRRGEISEAIRLISQVESKYQRASLVTEAWKIAKAKNNISAIKQLLMVKLEKYQFQELFKRTIETLFEMEAESDAVYLVTFTKFPDDAQDYGWYLLSKLLLSRKEYEKVEHIYSHLTTKHYRSEIAEQFLLLDNVCNEAPQWMNWFGLYQQHASQYGSNKHLETAKKILAQQSEVEVVVTLIGKNFSTDLQEILLKSTYLSWLISDKVPLCQKIESQLPEALLWLSDARVLATTGVGFEVLEQLQYDYRYQEAIIACAIKCLIENGAVATDIINAANEVTYFFNMKILLASIRLCISLKKPQIAVELLPSCDQSTCFEAVSALSVEGLSEQTQTILLRFVDFNRYGAEQLLRHYSPELIDQEHRRRAKSFIEKVETEYLCLKKISRKHPKYNEICKAIENLIDKHCFAEAEQLSQILVPSNVRDSYVLRLLNAVLSNEAIDFLRAARLANMFCRREFVGAANSFIKQLKQHDIRGIIKCAAELPMRLSIEKIIASCMTELLSHKNLKSPLSFLERSSFLTSRYCDYNIKKQIASALLVHFGQNYLHLIQRIKRWAELGVNDYDQLVLKHLLENNQLKYAFMLLNELIEESWSGSKSLPEKYFSVMREHIANLPPAAALYSVISVLDLESERRRLFSVVCELAIEQRDSDGINIINDCPDKTLRSDAMVTFIESCLISDDFVLIDQALEHLDDSIKDYWSNIAMAVKNNRYVEIINISLREGVFSQALITWLLPKWLEGKTAEYLIKNHTVLEGYHKRFELELKEIIFDNYDAKHKHYDLIKHCSTLLSNICQHWWQIIEHQKAPDYDNLLSELAVFIPWISENHNHYISIKIQKYFVQQALRLSVQQIISYFQLTRSKQSSACINVREFWDALFAEADTEKLRQLISHELSLGDNGYGLTARERLLSLYIERTDYSSCLELLPDDMSVSERYKLQDLALKLIKAKNIKAADALIEKIMVNPNEHLALPIINALLQASYLRRARKYIHSHIHTPSQSLALRMQLRVGYWQQLERWIGKDQAQYIATAFDKIALIAKLLQENNAEAKVVQLQNEVVQEFRNELDRSMDSFCHKNYNDCKEKGLYFPMVPTSSLEDPETKLRQHFAQRKMPSFSTDHPEIFAFLVSIQPVNNPRYSWLELLFPMVNTHKHKAHLPLQNDTCELLQSMANGLVMIMLKLKNPRCTQALLQEYLPDQFTQVEHPVSKDEETLVI